MTYTGLTARDAVELIAGPGNIADAATLAALVRAERSGRATVNGANVECTGHLADAIARADFQPATALYRVTF